jgi:xanthine dehydrogenase small subunit
VAAVIRAAPRLTIETVAVAGPRVSPLVRAAGWAEAAVLRAAAEAVSAGHLTASVATPAGARAQATVDLDGEGWPSGVDIMVSAGDPLDEVVLRSYVQGAAHMALGWVLAEGIAVDDDGRPTDLTIRSFGVLRARDTPPIEVEVDRSRAGRGEPQPVSDAVFAAVAAAVWLAQGLPWRWPTKRGHLR